MALDPSECLFPTFLDRLQPDNPFRNSPPAPLPAMAHDQSWTRGASPLIDDEDDHSLLRLPRSDGSGDRNDDRRNRASEGGLRRRIGLPLHRPDDGLRCADRTPVDQPTAGQNQWPVRPARPGDGGDCGTALGPARRALLALATRHTGECVPLRTPGTASVQGGQLPRTGRQPPPRRDCLNILCCTVTVPNDRQLYDSNQPLPPE